MTHAEFRAALRAFVWDADVLDDVTGGPARHPPSLFGDRGGRGALTSPHHFLHPIIETRRTKMTDQMTYTIVIDTAADLLAACALDGDRDAISRELRDYRDQSSSEHEPDLKEISGLTLTDEEPEDEDRIVWRGHDRGWLTDTTGAAYHFAVRT